MIMLVYQTQRIILRKHNYTKNVGKPKKRDQIGVSISMSFYWGFKQELPGFETQFGSTQQNYSMVKWVAR
jgi:hypothetical protein